MNTPPVKQPRVPAKEREARKRWPDPIRQQSLGLFGWALAHKSRAQNSGQ